MKRQVVFNLKDDNYYNFFFTPGSIDSLKSMIDRGWNLVFIKDDKEQNIAVAVFEFEEAEADHAE